MRPDSARPSLSGAAGIKRRVSIMGFLVQVVKPACETSLEAKCCKRRPVSQRRTGAIRGGSCLSNNHLDRHRRHRTNSRKQRKTAVNLGQVLATCDDKLGGVGQESTARHIGARRTYPFAVFQSSCPFTKLDVADTAGLPLINMATVEQGFQNSEHPKLLTKATKEQSNLQTVGNKTHLCSSSID